MAFLLHLVAATNYDIWAGTGGLKQFQPSAITVYTGDTVTFKWASGNHSATADDDAWEGTIEKENDEFTLLFDETGTYRYYSKNWGWKRGFGMCGRIVVLPIIVITTGTKNND